MDFPYGHRTPGKLYFVGLVKHGDLSCRVPVPSILGRSRILFFPRWTVVSERYHRRSGLGTALGRRDTNTVLSHRRWEGMRLCHLSTSCRLVVISLLIPDVTFLSRPLYVPVACVVPRCTQACCWCVLLRRPIEECTVSRFADAHAHERCRYVASDGRRSSVHRTRRRPRAGAATARARFKHCSTH